MRSFALNHYDWGQFKTRKLFTLHDLGIGWPTFNRPSVASPRRDVPGIVLNNAYEILFGNPYIILDIMGFYFISLHILLGYNWISPLD
jgi:hypothetical protein